jgi:hypothetical protein
MELCVVNILTLDDVMTKSIGGTGQTGNKKDGS